MRTQRDIQRDQFKNKLGMAIVELVKEFPELNQHDILVILSETITRESWALIKYYDIKERK